MRVLLTIAFSILGIIVLALIIALFVNKNYSVERSITINQPKEKVYEYLKMLKNQDNFSKWGLMDPNMKKNYTGTDGTVGFVSAWNSENSSVGAGEQEIVKIDDDAIYYELRFLKPFKSTTDAYMKIEAVGSDQTIVKWGFDGRMNYPLNLFLLFMDMEKAVGDDFQTGLVRLKDILEKQ